MSNSLTLCNPMDCRPSGSSVHGIPQARILEWVPMIFSRGSSQPRDQTSVSYVSCIGRQVLYHWEMTYPIKKKWRWGIQTVIATVVREAPWRRLEPWRWGSPGDVCRKSIPGKKDSHARPWGRSMFGKSEGCQGTWRGEGARLGSPRRTVSLRKGRLPVFHVPCFKTEGDSEVDPECELGHSQPKGWVESWRLIGGPGILWATGVPWLVVVLSGLFLLGLKDVSILGWVVTLMVKYDCLPFLLTKTGERFDCF